MKPGLVATAVLAALGLLVPDVTLADCRLARLAELAVTMNGMRRPPWARTSVSLPEMHSRQPSCPDCHRRPEHPPT
jgi:hypothetical protein